MLHCVSTLLCLLLPLALGLRELGVVLSESLAQTLRLCHLFLHTACDAAGLTGRKRFGGEVVDARHEAVVHEVSEDLPNERQT